MLALVSVVLQRKTVPPVAVKVAISLAQIASSPVMLAVGKAFTATLKLSVSVQPFPSVTVTE